tara:strand:- start:6228 stop:7289 length:1062 start_codon:yes stop_codon:yes gene_type:complete
MSGEIKITNRILPEGLVPGAPITALAPMQDVTTLPFMKVVAACGAPDYFFTEYFRVHEHSRLEPHILESITENPSERPVFAQMIGESLPDLGRTVRDLLKYPVAGVDLNMGCPAPKVYKKNVGGGLLRDPKRVDAVLGFLREHISGLFTVKMRIGFDSTEHFDALLDLINKHKVDLLSLHGRTVKEMYRSEVHYDFIQHAAERAECPVLANGNITSAEKARTVLNETGAWGVMIGRSAIRNPWIFRQFRELMAGEEAVFAPTLADVRAYVELLREATNGPTMNDMRHASRMKKLLNFVGQGVDAEGLFLKAMRRAQSLCELLKICDTHLLQEPSIPFASEPFLGVVARPNCEC